MAAADLLTRLKVNFGANGGTTTRPLSPFGGDNGGPDGQDHWVVLGLVLAEAAMIGWIRFRGFRRHFGG